MHFAAATGMALLSILWASTPGTARAAVDDPRCNAGFNPHESAAWKIESYSPSGFSQENIHALLAKAEVEYQEKLTAAGIRTYSHYNDPFGMLVSPNEPTVLGRLTDALWKINVFPIFNSCRRVGILTQDNQNYFYLHLKMDDLKMTELEIPSKLKEARITRDFVDRIDVARSVLHGNVGQFAQYRESIDIHIGDFQKRFEARHISRRQRRFRLLPDQIASNAKQKLVLDTVRAKETEFTRMIANAIKLRTFEDLSLYLSSYFTFTGIPNQIVKTGKGFEIEVQPLTEQEWQKLDRSYVDGVDDPLFSREYPELVKFAQMASTFGIQVRFPLDQLIEDTTSSGLDSGGKVYNLGLFALFSEFFQERLLLSKNGLKNELKFRGHREDESVLEVTPKEGEPIAFPLDSFGYLLTAADAQLRKYNWSYPGREGVPPAMLKFVKAFTFDAELLKMLKKSYAEGKHFQTVVAEGGHLNEDASDRPPEEMLTALAEDLERASTLIQRAQEAVNEHEMLERKVEDGLNRLTAKPNHPDAVSGFDEQALGQPGIEYLYAELTKLQVRFSDPDTIERRKVIYHFLERHPDRIFSAYRSSRATLLSDNRAEYFLRDLFVLLEKVAIKNPEVASSVLLDIVDSGREWGVRTAALKAGAKILRESDRLPILDWIRKHEDQFVHPNLVQRSGLYPPKFEFDHYNFSLVVKAIHFYDPSIAIRMATGLIGKLDRLGTVQILDALKGIGYESAPMIHFALQELSTNAYDKYHASWYLGRVGKYNSYVIESLARILKNTPPEGSDLQDTLHEVIVALDLMEVALPSVAPFAERAISQIRHDRYMNVSASPAYRVIVRSRASTFQQKAFLIQLTAEALSEMEGRFSTLYLTDLLKNLDVLKQHFPHDPEVQHLLNRFESGFKEKMLALTQGDYLGWYTEYALILKRLFR